MERWRSVVNFKEGYEVSNRGKVRSIDRVVHNLSPVGTPKKSLIRGKLLKPTAGKIGHLFVKLYRKGKKDCKTVGVHRLVLEAFVGPCPDGMQCRHLDGNPTNNRVKNLKWGTPQENVDDRGKHGRHNTRGANNFRARLKEEDIPIIRQMIAGGERGCLTRAAERFGVAVAAIRSIKIGETWSYVK